MIDVIHVPNALKSDITEGLRVICLMCRASHHQDEHPHQGPSMSLPQTAETLAQKLRAAADIAFVGVAERMRLYRLDEGAAVPLHTDNDYSEAGGIARYSVLVYLNDAYSGGETVFRGVEHPKCDVGDALIFRHDVPHEGRPVRGGTKLVLKTDLLVRA